MQFQHRKYASSSAAGEAARVTVTGGKINTNGWTFWQVEGDGGEPQTLEQVRGAFLKR